MSCDICKHTGSWCAMDRYWCQQNGCFNLSTKDMSTEEVKQATLEAYDKDKKEKPESNRKQRRAAAKKKTQRFGGRNK